MAMLFPRPQTEFSKEECEEFRLAILPQTPPSSLRTILQRDFARPRYGLPVRRTITRRVAWGGVMADDLGIATS